MTTTTILSIWGALLSTVLFFFKILEVTKNSFRRIRVQFYSDEYNKINIFTIVNYSSRPVNISYYEAFFAHTKGSNDKLYINFGIDGELMNVHIKPHEKCDLSLQDSHYFNPYSDKFSGMHLFMKIFETGTRKAKWPSSQSWAHFRAYVNTIKCTITQIT
ncbi:MAG: hypothetical protein HYU71_13765 [Bacteroidetes bacterium]|nr:hypothetical protein [Bacteroidota bacterium]